MNGSTIGVGIIGVGDRGCFVLGARLREVERETGLRVVALCDTNPARLEDASSYLSGHGDGPAPTFHLYRDYRELIDDAAVDLILVTTHTYLHRDPTIYALESGKAVYLDKPISVTEEDARSILTAEERTGNRLIMGFTRRYEASWQAARTLVADGAIGDVHMLQIRSLIPYTRYLQMWHRKKQYSGGALNDKSSHHIDVFNWFVNDTCSAVTAFGGRSGIFAPDPSAPTHCAVCDRDCPYRRGPDQAWSKEGAQVLGYRSWAAADNELDRADTCVYQPGADIEDHVIASFAYENGVKASLFWSIFGPPAPDQETLEVLGSSGRLVLTRSTGTIELISEYGTHRETIKAGGPDFASSHYGADLELVRRMRRFVDGEIPTATARDGYQSLRMIQAVATSIAAGGAVQAVGAPEVKV
ncbi:MAG: Gfo/Idh/MocA family oxidoreductase [Spirochaeta sp.]|jgi:predicted dehydrogenase|nr:Gfo/Idh/MocA family oxidoreductase [Spirochaeta sp.]